MEPICVEADDIQFVHTSETLVIITRLSNLGYMSHRTALRDVESVLQSFSRLPSV